MAILAKLKPSEFKPLDAGTHLAICDAVVAVGLQKTKYGNKDTLYLRFEVPAERSESTRDGEEVDEPVTIWALYNNSLHEKAKLRQHLEAWRGKDFTPQEEVDGFDLSTLLGKPCMISVKHSQTGDKTYANVDAVAKIMKGQEIPPQELPSICFGPDDTDQWEDLPKFLQDYYDARVILEEPEPPTQVANPEPEPEPEPPTQVANPEPEPEPQDTEVVSMEGGEQATDDFEDASIPF
jgi:hypothetical protein